MNRKRLASIVLVMLTLGLAACAGKDPAARAVKAMERAEKFELLSLSPERTGEQPGEDRFHGWQVLGRTTVMDEATRSRLAESLRRGATENTGMVAMCFNPRHGVSLTHGGKTTDLVICFECLQVNVYEDGQRKEGFLVSESPQPTFDEELKRAGIRLAD